MKSLYKGIVLLSLIVVNTVYADKSSFDEVLIDTVLKHEQTNNLLRSDIKGNSIATERSSEIMVRVKVGVNPSEIYKALLSQNNLSTLDATLMNSFPLVGPEVSISGKKVAKKHLLIIQSSKLSANALIRMADKIQGVDLVEKSEVIRLKSATSPAAVIPNDTSMSSLWGMHNSGQTSGSDDADIDAPEAWERHQGSASVVVGVIDTGIDYTHAELQNNMWINYAERDGTAGVDDDENGHIDDIYGIDTVNNDSDPMDDNGHGTHCAGTIAAEGNNNIGVVGVNWRAKVAGCKFLSASGSGSSAGAVTCINYFNTLKENGVNIVATNNSWGGGGFSQILKDVIDAGGTLGINFVAAAGNSNSNNDATPHYPSSYTSSSIIAVAATDHNDAKASFSSYGATSVDLAAPGKDILSTVPSTETSSVCVLDGGTDYFTEGFENGMANWSVVTVNPDNPFEDLTDEHWELDTTDGATGSNSLSDSLGGNYNNSRLQSAVTATDLSNIPSSTTVCASIKVKGQVENNYDYFRLYASNNGGTNWYAISNTVEGTYNDWTEISIPLSSTYYVANFKIALVRYSDSSLTYTGYNVDDLKISTGAVTNVPAYDTYSGTSMAAPHVAGAVAFFASINDQESAVTRKNRILNSVDVLGNLNGVVATGGRLNINNYLNTLNYASILGEWTLTYNWTASTVSVTINDDFTATFSDGNTAHWTYNGQSLEFIFPSGTTYSTTTLDLATGNMAGTMFNGSHDDTIPDGTWNAVKGSGGSSNIVDNDFNGDGISDILIRHQSTGRMYGMLLQADGSFNGYTHMVDLSNVYKIEETARLNNDLVSDVLLRHTSSGAMYSMIMNADGTKKIYKFLGTYPASNWSIKGVKDLNGDGIDDVLIFSQSSGNLYSLILKADGSKDHTINYGNLSSWLVKGIADLNGDGINDVLISNSTTGKVYSMLLTSTGARASYKLVGTYSPSSWSIDAVGNFSDDNIGDFILKHTNGKRYNMKLNSNGQLASAIYLDQLNSLWTTVDTGDFNGDAVDDLQIKLSSGNSYFILMNGNGTRKSYKSIGTFSPSTWNMFTASNHNNDATSDLLMRRSDGAIYTWLTNSSATVSAKKVSTTSTSYKIKNK